jgi:hypothetical protein
MRKNRLHIFSIIVGSVLAFAISFSQYLAPERVASTEKAKTEQTENNGSKDEFYISLPTFSLPVPVHLQPSLDAYCLFEIFFEKDTDVDPVEEDLFYTDRFFQTLFRVIISPNAP